MTLHNVLFEFFCTVSPVLVGLAIERLVEAVRTDPERLALFKKGTKQHKTYLYAVTQPMQSFRAEL